jgi:hypothetical protein
MTKKGRPREWQREEIADTMLIWARKDRSFSLNGFCAEFEIDPTKISLWAKQDGDFRNIYNIVKAIIADRRERGVLLGILHNRAYQNNAQTYDYFMREELYEAMKYETELKRPVTDIEKTINVVINKLVKSK